MSESWCTPMCKICFEGGHEAKDCTEDKNDFELIAPLAAFIGARLNYILPPCNSGTRGGKYVSTIKVDQHKEKFWYAKIYCTLADERLVSEKWLAERAREADGEDPKPEFVAKCLRTDAIHYRNCYMDAVKIIPRLRKRIIAQADYRELLFRDAKELCDYIDGLVVAEGDTTNVSFLKYHMTRWNAKDAEELKETLLLFYERQNLREKISD